GHGWHFWRYIKTTGRLIAERLAHGVPYIAVCGVSTPEIGEIEIDDFPGLLSCHSVQNADLSYQVYSYWAGRDSFETHREIFLQKLPGSTEVAGGRLARVKVGSKTLAEKFPFWTVVITISALIGAITALWEYGARLVETPDITVSFKRD